MATSGRNDAETTAAVAQVVNGLEQVRELLFGQHYRDFERKLSRLEAQLAGEAEELRKEMRLRLENLQNHVIGETEAMAKRLEADRAAQLDALNAVAREARDATTAVEQRMARAEESLARAQREARQQVLGQAEKYLDELQRTRAELSAALEREMRAFRLALEEGDRGAQHEAAGAGRQSERH